MLAWYWFWMAAIAVSAVLFFGVALLVAIFGWRDLRDLYRELDASHQGEGQDRQLKRPE
jgi:ABC-type phosphate transport system auxiliary subunit